MERQQAKYYKFLPVKALAGKAMKRLRPARCSNYAKHMHSAALKIDTAQAIIHESTKIILLFPRGEQLAPVAPLQLPATAKVEKQLKQVVRR